MAWKYSNRTRSFTFGKLVIVLLLGSLISWAKSDGDPNEQFNCLKLSRYDNFTTYVQDLLRDEPDRSSIACYITHGNPEIPTEIARLENLRSLTLKYWGGEIPSFLFRMTNLTQLDLSSRSGLTNQSSLPWQLGNLTSLTSLSLRSNRFTGKIPAEFGRLANLQILDLTNNLLTEIPETFNNMTNLRTLVLADNLLTEIHESLIDMPNLQELYLSNNQIAEFIPPSFGQSSLANLQTLNLAGNLLTEIPESFNMTNLRKLDLSNNQITVISPSFGQNGLSLQTLNLANNDILTEIPPSLGRLDSIKSINLASNRLHGEIPLEVIEINELKELNLYNNSLDVAASEAAVNKAFEKQVDLRLNGNPIVCDAKLLSWYPEYTRTVLDDVDIVCGNSNIYGELDLNPKLLRADVDAPETHALVKEETVNTSTNSISFSWSYDKRNTTFSKFGTVPYEHGYSLDEPLRNCLYYHNYKAFWKWEYIHGFDIDQDFSAIPPVLGFRIRWNGNSICFSEDEVSNNQDYQYTISNLKPATEYEIIIEPFNLQFVEKDYSGIDDYFVGLKARPFFGIKSKRLIMKTDDDIPEVGPSNIKLLYRADTFVTLEWDDISLDEANGEIIRYIVECLQCKDNGNYTSKGNSITLNQLNPASSYTVQIRGETSAGIGAPSGSVVVETCSLNTYSLSSEGKCDKAADGYFLVQPSGKSISCSSYPDAINQELCNKGDFNIQGLVLQNGYWRPDINSVRGMKVCENPSYCVTEVNTNTNSRRLQTNFRMLEKSSDQHCADYHTGVYCSDCLDGYTISSSGCISCDTEAKDVAAMKANIFIVFAALALISYMFKMLISAGIVSSMRGHKNMPGIFSNLKQKFDVLSQVGKKRLFTKVQIFIVTVQILFAFQYSLSTKFAGKGNENIFNTLITLDADKLIAVMDIYCFMEINFYQQLLFITLFPLALVIFIWLIYAVVQKCVSGKDMISRFYHEVFTACLALSFYIYAPVSRKVIQTFLCEPIQYPSGEENYLKADYRLSCDSEQYGSFLIFSSFMVIVYPLGILFVYAYLLHKRRQIFLQGINQSKDIDESVQKQLNLVEFLTYPYKDNFYWYETYELVRRLFLTSLLPVAVALEDMTGSSYTAEAYAFAIVIFSIIVLELSRPYKHQGDFFYAFISLLVLCVATRISSWSEFQITDEIESSRRKFEYETTLYSLLFWVEVVALLLAIPVEVTLEKNIPEWKVKEKNVSHYAMNKTFATEKRKSEVEFNMDNFL